MNLTRQKSKSLKSSVPYFNERLSNGEAVIGGVCTLQCKVDGYPKPEIHWERNGKQVLRSRNLQTIRNGDRCILELRNVREMDLGTYQCVAININGKDITQCCITVSDIPGMKPTTGKPTLNLKVPKTAGVRSRSAERENRRSVWRSNSLSGGLKDVENNIKNSTKRIMRTPLADHKNALHKLNSIKLQQDELQRNPKVPRTRGIGKLSKNHFNKELFTVSQKTDVIKSLCNEFYRSDTKDRDNLQLNAKRTRNDSSSSNQQPIKCSKQSADNLSPQVPIEKSEHSTNKTDTDNTDLCQIKVIIDDTIEDLLVEKTSSTSQSPQDVDMSLKTEIFDMPQTNLYEKMNNMSTCDDTSERFCANPPLTTIEQNNIKDVLKDRLQLLKTPALYDEVEENAVLTTRKQNLKLEEKCLPKITIDSSRDEDDDGEITQSDSCTCNCHQKVQQTSGLRQTHNGNLRYSPDVSECSPEEFPLEGQATFSLMESPISPRRSSSPLTINTKGPSKVLRGPVSVTVRNGEEVSLSTNFLGSSPNKITWTKAGVVITDGDGYSILNEEFESRLIIHSVTVDDSGKYVCSIENDFGGDSCFASVAVLGFPKPPGGPPTASDFTDNSLVLSWYGSMFDGGSVLTGYIVEMCHVPGRQWQTATTCVDTSCIVDGLSLGQRYVFRIRARNRYGQSEPSGETQTICLEDYQTLNEEKDENDELPNNIITIQKFADFMDRYDLKEEVGRGKFGKVHRCVDKWTGLPRAAKMIRCRKTKDRTDVHREIEVMKRLRHPKLLRIAGAFESDKMMVMVTEYISGGELFQRVIMDDFILTESDCILFMRQICDAVNYMHKCSVLHLDLKPENILCKTRTSHQIKIIDFGLSTFYNPKESLCILFGTPEFVAPEVIAFEPVGPASDMWSLGVICYVLLSGLSPFLGESERETFANITRGAIDFEEDEFDNISADAKNFISDIIIKNPRRRMTAAEALNHAWLKRAYWLEDYPPLSTEKLKKFIVRRKWQKSGTAIRALRRFVTLSRSSAESLGELITPATPISPAPTDSSEDSGIFQDSGCFDFPN